MNRIEHLTQTNLQPGSSGQPFLTNAGVRKHLHPIELAILKTSAYADIFDYPLTAQEIHFYLIGVRVSKASVDSTLGSSQAVKEYLEKTEGFFTLKGREAIIQTRRSRSKVTQELGPKAVRYGAQMARFPFVRMVALTGALAVGNVQEGADIDFLIVTENARVWTCRAMILLLVRLAALRGDGICPNYYLSERSLSFSERDIYTAHEIAQMVPIAGLEMYWRMRKLNLWTHHFLPNACTPNILPALISKEEQGGKRKPLETIFRLPLFSGIERWEMERKIRKFQRKYLPSKQSGSLQSGSLQSGSNEASFCPDWCKGHFDGHRQRAVAAYQERVSRFNRE